MLCRFVKVSHWIYLKLLKWLVSQWPYLVHHHPIAPHITLCGVLLVQNGRRSCPLDRNHTSFGFVVVVFIQVMRHAKVSILWTMHDVWTTNVRCTYIMKDALSRSILSTLWINAVVHCKTVHECGWSPWAQHTSTHILRYRRTDFEFDMQLRVFMHVQCLSPL